MIIAEAIESKWPFSAKVRARCVAPCNFKIGLHGFDRLSADSWQVNEHALQANDIVRLKVRRPYPGAGEVIYTSTIIALQPIG